jgi:hypothetical protein
VKWYAPEELEKMLRRRGHLCTTESTLPDSEQWVCEHCLTTVAQRKKTTANEASDSSYTIDLWAETPAGARECEQKPK